MTEMGRKTHEVDLEIGSRLQLEVLVPYLMLR